MNKLIPSLLIASVLGITATSAFACPDGKRGPNFERLSEKLELTDEQEIEFREIMKSKRETMKTYFQEQRAETLTKLSTVLNEEQLAEFEEMSERRMKRFKKKHQ